MSSRILHTGVGQVSNTNGLGYSFSFATLERSDIQVEVIDPSNNSTTKTVTTHYTIENYSEAGSSNAYIEFVSETARGFTNSQTTYKVRISRQTPSTPKVNFTAGSSITASDLNTQGKQAFHLSEENRDSITSLAAGDATGAVQISGSNIADNSITTNKILDLEVGTSDLANLAVTTAKIANSNVTTAKIADLNVTTAKIADSNVTTAKIANNTIVNGDINASAAIAQSKLNLSITDSEVNASANISPSKIATGTLPSGIKIDSNNLANLATFAAALTNGVLPSQTGNAGKYLETDGTNVSWSPVHIKTIKTVADTTETEFNSHGGFYNHPNIHVTINKQGGTKVLVICSFKMKATASTSTRPSRARLSGSGNFLYPNNELLVYSPLYEAKTLIGFDNGSSETGNTTYRLQASGSELNYNNPTDGRVDNAFMVAIEFATD